MEPGIRDVFLSSLESGFLVSEACELSGISLTTAYYHRRKDPEFKALWSAAYASGADALAREAKRRAVEGTQKPVFHKGEVCGHVTEYSDTLLMMLMKARSPEDYDDRVRSLLWEADRRAAEQEAGKADPTAHAAAMEAIAALERIASAKVREADEPEDEPAAEDEAECPTEPN